jgi:hypothetical protein
MTLLDFQDLYFTLRITIFLFLLHHIVRNLEFLAAGKHFKSPGIYSSNFLQLYNKRSLKVFKFAGAIFSYPYFLFLLTLSVVAAATYPFTKNMNVQFGLLSFVCITNLLLTVRNRYGGDGSDALSNVFNLTLFVSVAFRHNQKIQFVVASFIVSVMLLCYCAAGYEKARTKDWVNGTALYRAFNTSTYGSSFLADLFKKLGKTGNMILCRTLIGWQMAFPLSLLLPLQLFYIYLVTGVLFHLFNAVAFGFNKFLLIFAAGYPSLLFIKYFLDQHLY